MREPLFLYDAPEPSERRRLPDLTIAETALDDEALGLVGVSKLAQDASSSSRI